jgi:hypothetical protein
MLFTDESQFQLYRADGRQCVGEQFAVVNIGNRVPQWWGYGMGSHKLWTTNTIAIYRWQFEYEEIPRPIVIPFIRYHHLMFQHDTARPHVARIFTQFLGAENDSVLPWPAYSPDFTHQKCHPLSMFVMLWINSMFMFPPIFSNFAQPLKGSGTTFHNQQPDQL